MIFITVSCDYEELYLDRHSVIILSSPNYPRLNYPNNLDCIWIITNTETGGGMAITCIDLATENGYDFLDIGYGMTVNISTRIRRVMGESQAPGENSMPSSIIIREDDAWFNFYSDRVVVRKGFLLEIEYVSLNGKYSFFLVVLDLYVHVRLLRISLGRDKNKWGK